MSPQPTLKEIVVNGLAEGKSWIEMADEAKRAGHVSARNMEYSPSSLNGFAFRQGWLPNRRYDGRTPAPALFPNGVRTGPTAMLLPKNKELMDRLKPLVTGERAKNTSWETIARMATEQKLIPRPDFKWSSASISSFSINIGLVARVRNTVAGAAGTVGRRPSGRRSKRRSTYQPTYQPVEGNPKDAPELKARIVELRAQGASWFQVAQTLNQEGFAGCGPSGWTQGGVHYLATHRGWVNSKASYPWPSQLKKKASVPTIAPTQPQVKTQGSQFLNDVMDIMTSTLTNELKEKMLRSILRGE